MQSPKGKKVYEKVFHIVAPGETLIGLALKYSVTVVELRQWNKLPMNVSIETGQAIAILVAKDESELQYVPSDHGATELAEAGISPIAAPSVIDTPGGSESEDDDYLAAAADMKVRMFLKIKQGYLLRFFHKGYVKRFISIVDQHILDFESEYALTPSRIYEIKYPRAIIMRAGTDIQITFTRSNRRAKGLKMFLRAGSADEAQEWQELMDSISRKKIGTSVTDDRHITFEDFFVSITLESALEGGDRSSMVKAFPEDAPQYPLYNFSLHGFLRGCSYTPSLCFEEESKSSQLHSDLLMDDAVDAIADKFGLNFYSLKSVRALIDSFKSVNSYNERLMDPRLIALKEFWSTTPYWLDMALCERGRVVLSKNPVATIRACLFGALPVLFTSEQTLLYLKYSSMDINRLPSEFFNGINENYFARDMDDISEDMLPLIDVAVGLIVDIILNICSYRESWNTGSKDNVIVLSSLAKFSPAWEKLVFIRGYLSVIRRRAMSVFGKEEAWPAAEFGIPLSQAYCTFVISTFASSILEGVKQCHPDDTMAVLSLCRYVSHLLGFEISKNGSVWQNPGIIKSVSSSCYTFFSNHTNDTQSAVACLRKILTLRFDYFGGSLSRLWMLVPGNMFESTIAVFTGVDFAFSKTCNHYRFGRFGVYLWISFCNFVIWCIQLLSQPSRLSPVQTRRPGPPKRDDTIAPNVTLLAEVNRILPDRYDVDDRTFMIGIKRNLISSDHGVVDSDVKLSSSE